MDIDLDSLTPLDDIEGEDERETHSARRLGDAAHDYLAGHHWCKEVLDGYYGMGFDDKVGVFLFQVESDEPEVPSWIWVIHGEVPPLYIGTEDASTPEEALEGYIGAMEEWIDAVREGRSVDELAPVDASPTKENAEELDGRLKFIEKNFL